VQLILIAAGGAVGALARYGVSRLAQPLGGISFPAGTLVVNLTGAFLLGLVATYLVERTGVPAEWRIAATIGVIGSYTTYSTFSLETLVLLEEGQWWLAMFNVAGSVVGCIALAWAGQSLARA
jgi:fluoride exporter